MLQKAKSLDVLQTTKYAYIHYLLLVLAFLFLHACGGGSSEDSIGNQSPDTVTPPQGEESRTRYKDAYVDSGSECISEIQTRSCDNGTCGEWSGEHIFTNCTSSYNTLYYVDINDGACSDANTVTTEDTPFCSIARAVELVAPGDRVQIKEGVYRENLRIETSGTDALPIIFEANNNDTVVIDGSVIVNGWTQCASAAACYDNPNWQNIYYTTIDFHTDKLFENNALMTNAREPDFGYFRSTKDPATTCVNSTSITEPANYYVGALAEFQGTSTTAAVDWNNLIYDKYVVTGIGANRICFDYSDMTPLWGHSFDDFLDEMWFYVRNKVQYIDRPGEWALVDYLANAPYTVYLWAPNGDPNASLIEAAYQNMLIGGGIESLENVYFSGIDLKKVNKYPQLNRGAAYDFGNAVKNIVIQNSDIMFAETAIQMREVDGVIIYNNNLAENYNGIVLGAGLSGPVGDPSMSYIEHNTVGPNSGDGIQFYSVSDITVRNNHVHHHLSDRKHSDNIQMSAVKNIFVENNVIHDGGQNVIMQNTDTATISNNLIYNSHARSIILDSLANQNLEFAGNTFGYSYYPLLIRFSDTTIKNNVYAIGNHHSSFYAHDYLNRIEFSNYNYYHEPVNRLAHGNPWTSYSIQEWQVLGFDQNSIFGGGSFANVPAGVYMVSYFSEPNDIKVTDANTIFSVGDIIEYANDGVTRTVTSVDADSIGINPPLNYDNVGSLWGNYIIRWANNANIVEDYTPSGAICTGSESGGYIGAVSCARN